MFLLTHKRAFTKADGVALDYFKVLETDRTLPRVPKAIQAAVWPTAEAGRTKEKVKSKKVKVSIIRNTL